MFIIDWNPATKMFEYVWQAETDRYGNAGYRKLQVSYRYLMVAVKDNPTALVTSAAIRAALALIQE
ncbi:MAG: hypothetical protein ACXVCH_00065 [Bdellovibrionota bacterium]